jgi:DNA-binding XRE family transcriptional regulator
LSGEKIPAKILTFLKRNYTVEVEEEGEFVNWRDTELFEDYKKMSAGESIRCIRKNRELTQKALGEAIGVSGSRISEYERNAYPISKAVAKKLAKQLGTSVEHFI